MWFRQIGATVGQSIGEHLVVGSTLKLVTAGGAESVANGRDLLDEAADLDVSTETNLGLDAGLMLSFARGRIGLSARNVTRPSFGSGDDTLTLPRDVRVGAALLAPSSNRLPGVTLAIDADLTTVTTSIGETRRVAAGVEAWMASRRIGVRGGVSVNTTGNRRTSSSLGLSLGARSGMALDGFVMLGGDPSRQGWGIGVRSTF
jgi:hypothetical protein